MSAAWLTVAIIFGGALIIAGVECGIGAAIRWVKRRRASISPISRRRPI